MFNHPALKLCIAWWAVSIRLFGDCRIFLGNAALDRWVVLIEAERHAFAVEDFVADIGIDQRVHFQRSGRTLPSPAELGVERCRDIIVDAYVSVSAIATNGAVEDKKHQADQQKVNQRLAYEPTEHATPLGPYRRVHQLGEYQIGLV
jgi:hypothetical protein